MYTQNVTRRVIYKSMRVLSLLKYVQMMYKFFLVVYVIVKRCRSIYL